MKLLALLVSFVIFIFCAVVSGANPIVPDYYGDIQKIETLEQVFLEPYIPDACDPLYKAITQRWIDEHLGGLEITDLRSRVGYTLIRRNFETGEEQLGNYIYLLFKMVNTEDHTMQFCCACIWRGAQGKELEFRGMYSVGIKYGV